MRQPNLRARGFHTSAARRLRDKLDSLARELHPRPASLTCNPRLFETLLALYDRPPDVIWREKLELFLDSHREPIELLYEEHRAFSEARVLDFIEAPMVIERLDHDGPRLVRDWPLDQQSLIVLSAAWGRPLYRAA